MSRTYNPPPNWPTPPAGWSPSPGWKPDPSWGPPPHGWQLWVDSSTSDFGAPAPPQRVFISYRRSDCQAQANGLHDGLSHRLKSAKIFMDIDSIPPGVDFEQHIRDEIENCDLVLVLIGDDWLEIRSEDGQRRIDDPEDFVRLEIESALASPRVKVVPVLVEGAEMPRASDLPESIRRLGRINAIELNDRRWTSDLERLAKLVEQVRGEQEAQAKRETSRPTASSSSIIPEPEPANVRLADLQSDVIEGVVARLPDNFRTKDLSQHPAIVEAHAELTHKPNYHTMVGRYLLKHRAELGLKEPGPATDDRGAVWSRYRRVPTPAEAPRYPSVHQLPARQLSGAGTTVSEPEASRTPLVGWAMMALPVMTFGLASFAPPLWARSKRQGDEPYRQRMLRYAIALGVLAILGVVLIGAAPTDSNGSATGIAADIGAFMMIAAMGWGTFVAVKNRRPARRLPGVETELVRRRLRQEYRSLASGDPALARNINVGRPDLTRDYDDGGLLDLNNTTADAMCRVGPLSADEAHRVVDTRGHIGGFTSLEEAAVYADLQPPTVERLKEIAVFL